MLQVGNENQDMGNCAKDTFVGLEAQDVNQVLETARVRPEHGCPADMGPAGQVSKPQDFCRPIVNG